MKKLFTLIELIVVIVVIGILAAIVVPNISNWQKEASKTAVVSNLKNIQTSIDMYSMEEHGALPGMDTPTEINPTPVDFGKLKPTHLRNLPKTKDIKYWVDFRGMTWASTIDSPVVKLTPMGEQVSMSWDHTGAETYRVYRLEGYNGKEGMITGSAKSTKLILEHEGNELSFTGNKNTAYIVSSVDENRYESAPAGNGYEPYPEFKDNLVIVGTTPTVTAPIEPQPLRTEVPAGWIGIYSLDDLNDMRNNLSGSYILMENLDFLDDTDYENITNKDIWSKGLGWYAVGVYNTTDKFVGHFDGNGLSISNLYINRSNRYVGLFGSTGTAIIENVTLKNAYVTSTDVSTYNGLLLGYGIGTTIKNVNVEGELKGRHTGQSLGGVVGTLNGGFIYSSKSHTKISGPSNMAGSLVGYLQSNAQIHDSYSSGEILEASKSGGLVGGQNNSYIYRSYSISTVNGIQKGGLTGNQSMSYSINSFWDMEASNMPTSFGGTGKNTIDMMKQSTYTTWDFNNVWTIDEGNDYPRLKWESQ